MTPKIDYLRKVESGAIVVRAEHDPAKGHIWHVTDGMALLRLHEEMGLVMPIYTAKWAGFPEKMQTSGVPAALTDKGRELLRSSN